MSDLPPANPLSSGSVDPLTEVVAATLAKMRADADSDAELLRRKRGWWDMNHGQNMQIPEIAKRTRAALLDAGLTEEQLSKAGVSVHRIRQIVEAPRP